MNKIANVVYPYSPKNDDELELKVGDKIEVIGVEEEGKCLVPLREAVILIAILSLYCTSVDSVFGGEFINAIGEI